MVAVTMVTLTPAVHTVTHRPALDMVIPMLKLLITATDIAMDMDIPTLLTHVVVVLIPTVVIPIYNTLSGKTRYVKLL